MTETPPDAPPLRTVAPPKGARLASGSAISSAIGPLPTLDWLRIEDLRIDDRYQRPLDAAMIASIQTIADNFAWSRFGAVLVAALGDGTYGIIDGQCRTHAAQLAGVDRVPCLVSDMTFSEQARAFRWVNGQVTRVSVWAVYRAALAAGEAWAINCRDAAATAGCRLMTANYSADQKKPGMIFCVGVIRRLVAQFGPGAVTAGLLALRNYDTKGRVALYSDYILGPWLRAVAEHPGALTIDLTAILGEHDPFRVIEAATRRREKGEKFSNVEAFRRLFDRALIQRAGGTFPPLKVERR